MNVTQTLITKVGAKEVLAYTSGVPGLVVHRKYGDRGWGLTHRPSGYLVTNESFRTRADAVSVAKRLAGLTDWAQPSDQLGNMQALGQRVRETIYAGLYATGPVRESVVESILPDGWELEGDDLDGLLVCPHGDKIEMDGVCSKGCVSPLRTAGLI